ncbi:MAG: PQQ-dependent sugar dehydrogenase [Phycisphaerales bacterium]|nr:PQQ-dependent sugar dehydrogenase [Phycisphaerales bacterium]MCB9862739.1 PQQ-dependent sugar dehydrogenase [Phycisphaerales bacterium]
MYNAKKLAITLFTAATLAAQVAAAAPRDVQIREVNFQTGVVQLFNFGAAAESLNGWQFCTFDDNQLFQYSGATGLNGRTINPGASLYIHTLNDAPGGDPDRMNLSALGGGFATPIDAGPFAMSLYGAGAGFTTASRMVDHVMWNINGANPGLTSRADIAVTAGLWTSELDYVSTTAGTVSINLSDLSGGLLHGPANYAPVEPAVDRDVQFRFLDFQNGTIELFNFGATPVDLSGWRLCTFDENQSFQYTAAAGLNGVSIDGGATLTIHTLNNAPADPTHINISALAGAFASPFDNGPYALSIYNNNLGGFTTPAAIVDHVMWDDGTAPVGFEGRADVAVAAGLWTSDTDFVQTASNTGFIQLLDISGGLAHGPSDYEAVAPSVDRDIQIRFVDFVSGTIELINFGGTPHDLSGWRFCTFDENQSFQYTDALGLDGVSIDAGATLTIHTLNDAPGGDPTRINLSALGGAFATPLDNGPYALSLYNNNLGGFTTPAAIVDHVMWDDGTAPVGFEGRADIAVAAGLWLNDTDFVTTTGTTAAVQLLDETGGLAHSPADYAVLEGALPLPDPIELGDFSVRLLPIATGLTSPVDLTHANDGSGRLYLALQTGQILVIENGNVLPAPFLDLTAQLPALNAGFDERGLLGIAFHPDFANNNRFFVRYSRPRVGDPGEACVGTSRGCHEELLSEFTAISGTQADAGSERILFRVDEPEFNHNSGSLAFGPDGNLYWGQGDGGGANDGLDNPLLPHGPTGNGQNIETALGNILRIDVDGPPDVGLEYKVPADNPFVGVTGVDEIYAYGFRNPFKIAFDNGPGGDNSLIVADVGQARIEEIDVVTLGGNYGWSKREGNQCFDPFDAGAPPAACVATGPFGEPLLPPFAEYDHNNGDGISIIGGFVHRGSEFPGLNGRYVFGDFSTGFSSPDGKLYHLDYENDSSTIFEFLNGPDNDPIGLFVKGFGEDANGEVYLLGSTALAPFGTGGIVMKIVPLKGDINGSGAVEFSDVAEFAAVLVGNENDANKIERADMDDSGVADGDDIAAFVAAILP